MHGEGFEPSHPKITDLKSAALDRSAIRAGAPVRSRTADLWLIRPML